MQMLFRRLSDRLIETEIEFINLLKTYFLGTNKAKKWTAMISLA